VAVVHLERVVWRQVYGGQTGVLLNNEMDDFTVKLGARTCTVWSGQANAIARSRRAP
jgi:gamma-glutamyltranspeptidase